MIIMSTTHTMIPSRRIAIILLIAFTILCIHHHYNSLSTTEDFYATRRLEDDDTADIIQQTYHNLKKDGLEPGTDEFTSKLRYKTHQHIKQIKPDYARQNIIHSRTRNELINKGYEEDSERFTNMLHTKSLRRIDSSEKTWFKKLVNRMVIQEKIDNHIARVSTVPLQSASSSRLITMNGKEEEIQKFPFYYAPESCVHVEDIIHITEFIKDLYIKHNIRVFPRNGFLLGIVRHGGFLPIEAIDVDMGVVYEDLLPLYDDDRFEISQSTNGDKRAKGYLDDFHIRLMPTEDDWVNWHGLEPVTQQRFPYMDAMLSRGSYKMHVVASYPYRDTGGYFYPRFDKAGFNHDVHVADALRYNEEGADYRLVDTDERIDSSNFNKDDTRQLATIFNTSFDCFMETQFYFTTILVPCDYDIILTSIYGKNWRYVEKRGPNGGPKYTTEAVSEEENERVLSGGPRPVCSF